VAARGRPRGRSSPRRGATAIGPVLFRAAGGPRLGYGHVVRVLQLARALGVEPRVSIRGGAAAVATARRLGARVVALTPSGMAASEDVLVIDDPSTAAARPWLRAARRAGIPVASLHDWGLAPLASDLRIHVSSEQVLGAGARSISSDHQLRAVGGSAHGWELMAELVDPGILRMRVRLSRRPLPPIVLIGLGGGRQARHGAAVARAIVDRVADRARVVLSEGVEARSRAATTDRIARVAPGRFRAALATAAVGVVGGGVTLWEAAALGTPIVAVPVVAAQVRAVRCFAAAGLAIAPARGARPGTARWTARLADAVVALLADRGRRDAISVRGPRLVDGRGALRIADAIRELARRSRG
jgi:hypothetical protein